MKESRTVQSKGVTQEDLDQLVAAYNSHADRARAATLQWHRHLLTVAAGAVAVLAAFSPDPSSALGRWFLVGSWFFLGLGIVIGGWTTGHEAKAHFRNVNAVADLFDEIARTGSVPRGRYRTVEEPIWYPYARTTMLIALALAVLFLVAFSIDRVVT